MAEIFSGQLSADRIPARPPSDLDWARHAASGVVSGTKRKKPEIGTADDSWQCPYMLADMTRCERLVTEKGRKPVCGHCEESYCCVERFVAYQRSGGKAKVLKKARKVAADLAPVDLPAPVTTGFVEPAPVITGFVEPDLEVAEVSASVITGFVEPDLEVADVLAPAPVTTGFVELDLDVAAVPALAPMDTGLTEHNLMAAVAEASMPVPPPLVFKTECGTCTALLEASIPSHLIGTAVTIRCAHCCGLVRMFAHVPQAEQSADFWDLCAQDLPDITPLSNLPEEVGKTAPIDFWNLEAPLEGFI